MQRIHNFFRFSKKIRLYVQSEINPQIKLTIDATEGEVLAKELKRHKVPLPFECGFSCSCSTCSVLIANSNDFSNIQIAQPQSQEEINVLTTEGKGGRVRLSCQINVCKELDGVTLLI
ncbi:unnamed protein product [Paramecium octaurelia]|uniref:2Fe-2S ferredoxin-type domain-containing protein n=1 Tax=Paramecium octaurelia TaxID=43137 RepID=A0A8S1X991_PAROT|nr:unnamed protein product [Paramecium octaurelia]